MLKMQEEAIKQMNQLIGQLDDTEKKLNSIKKPPFDFVR